MLARRIAVHLSVLVVGAAVLRVAVVPAEVCPPTTAHAVDVSIDAATAWLAGGLDEDGRYVYGYDRVNDVVDTSYNFARHAGVTMSLYQVYSATGSLPALEAADQGLALALGSLLTTNDWTAWAPTGGDIPVGANGLLLAALALRRDGTGDPSYDPTMRAMGRFLLGQQQADGSVYAWWSRSAGSPVAEYGPFATGEASWALALLDSAFPGEGWGEAAARTVDYMATARNANEGYLASLPDHWAAYTLNALRPDLLTDGLVDYARRLAGFFGIRLRFEAQRRGTGINLWVRWYPGPPAGVGTAGEGIGELRALSSREPRLADLTAAIDQRLLCTAGFMVERQTTASEAAGGARPELEAGAWFYRGRTQMDGQQHVLSALLGSRTVLEEAEASR